jgi:hypothetical protein
MNGDEQTVAIFWQAIYFLSDFMLRRTLLFPVEIWAQNFEEMFNES